MCSTARPKICLVTPEFPPTRWGGLARTVARVAAHVADLGLDTHVLHYRVIPGPPPLLDENHVTTRLDPGQLLGHHHVWDAGHVLSQSPDLGPNLGLDHAPGHDAQRDGLDGALDQGQVTVHEAALGREAMPDDGRSLWDCPHTLTLRMLFESLEILHRAERFHGFLSFFLYPTAHVVGLLARREGLPHVACAVGNDVKKYVFSPEKVAVCRSGLEAADRLVFLAQDLLDLANALTPVRGKSRVIFNSVSQPTIRWPGPRLGRPFTLGAAGIFKHAKGLPYLFKALALLLRSGEARLELAGETRPEEVPLVEALLDRLAIRDVVSFRGVVPHADMPAWLAGLDVFVLPSLSEGCPNVLMEAMAAGLPCVASCVGAVGSAGPSEADVVSGGDGVAGSLEFQTHRAAAPDALVEHGVSGLLVPWGNTAALAVALDQVRRHPDLAARLGREATRRMTLFSADRERAAWEAVLREVLAW